MKSKIVQDAKGENIVQNYVEELHLTHNNITINGCTPEDIKKIISSDSQVSNFIIKKDLLKDFNSTYQVLSNFLFDSKITDASSTLIDTGFANFLNVVLGKESFNEKTFDELCALIISKHDLKIKEILKVRLNCISHYWNDEKELIVSDLKKIIDSYKDDNSVSKWLINNIAIDLRNQEGLVAHSYGQEIIDSSDEPVFFPLLDRISNNIKDNIIKFHKESILENPYSSSNTSLKYVLSDLTSYYCVSVLYGSLTHILIFKSLLYEFAYSIFQNEKNPVLFSKIIELNILNHNDKEIELLLRKYDGINLNFININSIIKRIEKLPTKKDIILSKLILLKWFGLYIKDEDFRDLSTWFYEFCDFYIKEIIDKFTYTSLIKDVFNFSGYRLNCNDTFNFIVNLCKTKIFGYVQLACDIFTSLDIGKLNNDQQIKIRNIIFEQITTDNALKNISNYGYSMLIPFCKKTSISYEAIVNYLKENYPDFYIDFFCLEFETKDSKTYLDYIMKQVSTISSRTNVDAKIEINFGDDPYETIKNILQFNHISLEEENIKKIISPLNDILMSNNQTAREKKSAFELLMYLIFKYRKTLNWNKIINKILKNSNLTNCKNISFFDKTSLNVINFYISILKLCVKINKANEFLIQISQIGNMSDYDKICIFKEFSDLLKLDDFKTILSKEISSYLIEVIVANSTNKDRDVSFYAIKSLCLLLYTDKKQSILSYLEVTFPYFSWVTKKVILTSIKDLNDPIVKKIQIQGKADANFCIRSL